MESSVTYIANPYTGTAEERGARFRAVEKYTAYFIEQGNTGISPIVHCHELADRYGLPTNFEFWQEYCLNILAVCDYMHVLMLDGWKESVGVQAEIAMAEKLMIPITYIDAESYEEFTRPEKPTGPSDREIYDEMDGSAMFDAKVEDLY